MVRVTRVNLKVVFIHIISHKALNPWLSIPRTATELFGLGDRHWADADPTPAADVTEMHGLIREWLAARFGAGRQGKPSNATKLMAVANVDGALVGGASLKAAEFLAIARVYE